MPFVKVAGGKALKLYTAGIRAQVAFAADVDGLTPAELLKVERLEAKVVFTRGQVAAAAAADLQDEA